jgi:hypothetical protein
MNDMITWGQKILLTGLILGDFKHNVSIAEILSSLSSFDMKSTCLEQAI